MSKHTTTFVVNDMCCSSEERLIRKKLGTVEGVEIRGINLIEKTVNVNHSCATGSILSALDDIGMKASLLNDVVETQSFWNKHGVLILTVFSGVMLAVGLLRSAFVGTDVFAIVLFLAVVLASGWEIILKGFKAIKNISLDMNFLMMIATAGAMTIGKWGEGAMVMFLFALAEMLERFSLKRSRNAIQSLMRFAPKVARVVTENETAMPVMIDVENIRIGQHIVIRPGEQIPLDGVIVSGTSSVNQAQITGESTPVQKNIGDTIFAGSYNERGALEIEVTKAHNDTMLARIVRLVEEAQESRAPINSLVDTFARYYTPIVFTLACVVALVPTLFFHQEFSLWFYKALVLLVIACPCALVLSTPVTIMSGLANAARRGVLIKGGRFLEILGSIKAIAFDKTGTLTKGSPRVTDVISLNSLSNNDILSIASRVEHHSEHHLATAVKQKATEQNILLNGNSLYHFESLPGKGVRAEIDGKVYIVGSHQYIEELSLCSAEIEHQLEQLERNGKTTILLATEHEVLGIIAIADELRNEAVSIIKKLHTLGIEKTILLTGDNRATAKLIAEQAGIDELQHEVLPDQKVAHITELRKRYGMVAMVGDGVNDAPALASATVGIAMGKTGTDVSLEAADVVLISDELGKIPYAIGLSRKTVQIIKQNITIALVTKVIFLTLALFGKASLWMAIIADDGATLAVILNGLRVLRFREK